jgi:hypothetical protein
MNNFLAQSLPSNGNILSNTEVHASIRIKQEQKSDKTQSFISLVFILDTLFILNQLGYCMVGSLVILKMIYGHDVASSDAHNTIDFISYTLECLSHSLNFYCYLKFSSLVRQEFLLFLSRCGLKG